MKFLLLVYILTTYTRPYRGFMLDATSSRPRKHNYSENTAWNSFFYWIKYDWIDCFGLMSFANVNHDLFIQHSTLVLFICVFKRSRNFLQASVTEQKSGSTKPWRGSWVGSRRFWYPGRSWCSCIQTHGRRKTPVVGGCWLSEGVGLLHSWPSHC